MLSLRSILAIALTLTLSPMMAQSPCTDCPKPSTTYHNPCPGCCENMGGVHYCDSSAGRFVCKNGYYSSCYCSRHAVMELEKIQGCCLWQGGVMVVDETGLVVCNNGGVSEICTLQHPSKKIAAW